MTQNKGQSIQAENPINVLNNINDLDGISTKIPHYFLSKKAEKLSIAVYLVTGFLSDKEPIKWQIREVALKIISNIIFIEDLTMSEREQHLKSVSLKIEKIISLLEIAVTAGFVSEMNFSILREEYSFILEMIKQQKIAASRRGYVFAKDFFLNQEVLSVPRQGNEYKGHHIKDKENVQNDTRRHNGQFELAKEEIKERKFSAELKNPSLELDLKGGSKKTLQKNSRRELILSLIKDKGELSIKDIIGHISDCGEKTVQRELTALVGTGILKKVGERRWSRYSFPGTRIF